MPREEYEKDFRDESSCDSFGNLLNGSERVITMPHEGLPRDRQYEQAGVFISNHCQILLAIWDGRDKQDKGGTADILHYHLTGMHSSESHLNESPNLLADNENDLAYHLACSREAVPGGPGTDLEPGQGRWLTAHFLASGGDRMPESYRHMLERLVDYQADCDRLNQKHGVASGGLIPQADVSEQIPVPAHASMLDGLFCFADRLAVHYQKRVLTSLVVTHALAVLMGLSFILYSENTDQVCWCWLSWDSSYGLCGLPQWRASWMAPQVPGLSRPC